MMEESRRDQDEEVDKSGRNQDEEETILELEAGVTTEKRRRREV